MTPYKQAFVLTMQSGAVALATVIAHGRDEGEQMAREAISPFFTGSIWDMCDYPVSDALAVGVAVLRKPNT